MQMQVVSYRAVAAAAATPDSQVQQQRAGGIAGGSSSSSIGSFFQGDRCGGLKEAVASRSRSLSRSGSTRWCVRAASAAGSGIATEDRAGFVAQASASGRIIVPSELRVYDVVAKQAALVEQQIRERKQEALLLAKEKVKLAKAAPSPQLLEEAYVRCGQVCAEYAKTFYLGTKLMTPERQRAIWAMYVWCRRTDELVDGPNASRITPTALDRWEERLEDVFRGQPYDMLDAALADMVAKFPVDIQPYRDMIDGMRMDLVKSRYANFDELYMYCYNVAGTVGLMSVPIMGIAPESRATTESVYSAALALGIANQLTNILRDVGEDARRGRVYLPQDELAQFGLCDEDIFAGRVTDKWRAFMKDQITRARLFFAEAESGVVELDKDSRWPVWACLMLYQQILDEIERNDYDNFSKRAYVGKVKKLFSLPTAYVRALVPPPSSLKPQKQLFKV